MRIGFSYLVVLLCISSCTYEKAEVIIPVIQDTISVCDSSNITYSQDIQPLMLQHCGTDNACHSTALSTNDTPLDSYELDTLFAGTGQLLNSITSQNGEDPKMPKDGDKLSECDVNKIRAWINQGMSQ
jgi:hypothetical protein